jgi:hypothetical protein
MIQSRVIGPDAAFRPAAELLIRKTYADQYSAILGPFPRRLIASIDGNGVVLCAAGLRSSEDGFFSERYLDAPIEQALTGLSGSPVLRSDIFEVSTLVSRCPTVSAGFIRAIVEFGREGGFRWSFFTLTRRLRIMVARIGLPVVTLAPADPARMPGAEAWGSYYACSPSVCAVPDGAFGAMAPGLGGSDAVAA